jgi:transglutaminase-like putative cysteine protease
VGTSTLRFDAVVTVLDATEEVDPSAAEAPAADLPDAALLSTLTTAAGVHTTGRGVCRDFAHLALSFCRALKMPARYVFG